MSTCRVAHEYKTENSLSSANNVRLKGLVLQSQANYRFKTNFGEPCSKEPFLSNATGMMSMMILIELESRREIASQDIAKLYFLTKSKNCTSEDARRQQLHKKNCV